MLAVCNVDYIVDISSSDRIARERFRFPEDCLLSRNLYKISFWKNCCGYRDGLLETSRRLLAFSRFLSGRIVVDTGMSSAPTSAHFFSSPKQT